MWYKIRKVLPRNHIFPLMKSGEFEARKNWMGKGQGKTLRYCGSENTVLLILAYSTHHPNYSICHTLVSFPEPAYATLWLAGSYHLWLVTERVGSTKPLIQFHWCMSGVILRGIWLWGVQINTRKYWTRRQLCTKPYGIQHIRQWATSLALRTRGLGSLWNFLMALATNPLPEEVHLTLLLPFITYPLPLESQHHGGEWWHFSSALCSMLCLVLPFCFDRMGQFNMEPGRMIGLGRKTISHINEQGYMVIRSLGVKYVTVQNRHIRHFRMLHF